MRVNQGRQDPQPNQEHVETQVPATQAKQAKDDVAPVTAEYVPAKARWLVDSKTILVSNWDTIVRGSWGVVSRE
jgi:hypothetical protein